MTSKKQKRLVGEAKRAAEESALKAAQDERRKIAEARERRKAMREMQQTRRANTLSAMRTLRGGKSDG